MEHIPICAECLIWRCNYEFTPPKKSDMGKGWMQRRVERSKKIQPQSFN